jgi:alkylhydroperoxidase family enzyme
MARIPYADLEKAHPKVREVYDGLTVKLNLFRMMAHAERNFGPLTRLGGTILARQELSDRLRELAILYVAQLSSARYEWVQHVPIAERAGVSSEQIAALESGDIRAACFDDEERNVLEFTLQVVRDVRPTDQALEALAGCLSHREIVELTIAVSYYMMMARLMEVTGVDLEEPGGTELVDRIRASEA